MSTADVAGISAAVSAGVSAIVNALIKWGGQAVAWVRKVTRADHSALGGVANMANNALRDRVGVHVAFAPIRCRRNGEVDIDKAIDFVHAKFGPWFPDKPEYAAPGHGVRFVVKVPVPVGMDEVTGMVKVSPSGLVELYWAVEAVPDPGAPQMDWLPLEDVVWPLVMLWSAIGSEYRDLGDFVRRGRRRFDWYFSIGTHLTRGPENMTRFWKIQFPGRPALRASANISSCPANGCASDLRSLDCGRGWSLVATKAMTRLLKYNGYYRCEPALEDCLAVVEQRRRAASSEPAQPALT